MSRSLVPLQRRHHALAVVATWALTMRPNTVVLSAYRAAKTNFIDRLPKTVQRKIDAEYVRQPIVKAGDVILFAEALMQHSCLARRS